MSYQIGYVLFELEEQVKHIILTRVTVHTAVLLTC